MTFRMRRRYKYIAALMLVLLVAFIGASWFLRSGWLEDYIVRRAKAEVQKTLGATLTMGKLTIDLWGTKATIDSIEIRGKEPVSAPPLFSAKQVQLVASLSTLSSSRVDLRAISIVEPKFNIITFPDGTTNIPGPAAKSSNSKILESVVNWRLGRLDIEKGEFSWNEQRIPFSVAATDIKARLDYLPPSRIYQGVLDSSDVVYKHASLPPVNGSTSVEFAITSEKIRIDRASFRSGSGSVINARGSINNLDSAEDPLRLDLDVDATIAVAQAMPFLALPIEPSGVVNYVGKLLFEAKRGLELHGDAKARDLFYRDATTRLGPLRASTKVDLLPARFTLSKIEAEGIGGALDGNFQWNLQEGWRFDGDVKNVSMAAVLNQLNVQNVPWSGKIHGPVEAQGGKKPLVITADLEIDAVDGQSPLTGVIALTYEDQGNRLLARNSFLTLPHSRINFAGDLAKGIAFELHTTALRELVPVLELAGLKEASLPISLQRGSATVSGHIAGSIKNPYFHGTVVAENLIVQGKDLEHVRSVVDYSDQLLTLSRLEARALGAELKGDLNVILEDGRLLPGSLITGKGEAIFSDLSRLPLPEPLKGALSASVALRGTWAEPLLSGNLRSPDLDVRGTRLQQVSATFTASRREVQVSAWEARFNNQPLQGMLNLKAGGNDWKIGNGNGVLRADEISLTSIPKFSEQSASINAAITTDSQLAFSWSPEGVSISKIDGKLTLARITRFGRPIGHLEFTSRTTGQRAALTATGAIGQLPVKGDATIQLGTRLESELRLQLPKLDFPTVAQLFSREILPTPLPYEGGAEASFYFKGPLLDPEGWDGRLTIPQLQLAPNKDYVRESMPTVADFVLKNEGPIVIEFRRGQIGARDVRLVAKDTNLNVSLLYQTTSKSLTGQAKGTINLAVLSTLKPDLLATGAASLDASIQGNADDPQLNGRLSFQNASFYLRDVITGLDKVNGALLFDKNRATIESLTAQTGGGELQLSGFVGFGRILSYRLQAQAKQVRLRYPEGISTTANAALALTGTTAQSILTGTVLILRSSVGQIDTAQLLSGSQGITDNGAPISNEFLSNLQFDLRIEAAQNVEFSTTLTKDVKGEVNLRLRGSPQRPVVLGRIAITQGIVDFFGARYEINRGEVNFTNPLRIEPIVGLDLETRVRGVAISITFNGPANKLNMSYRSDPPLQSNEILALLTVGRNPGANSSIAQQGPVGQTQGLFGNDSSVILGAAVTAGINGRLQRFFGISRVRLDPQLTGIDNVPQARLTLEQQVSRDVTLTYITNLNRTQQQIVRIDWDLSRTWTVVAVRDENGIFGLDLFFRKRIK